MGIIDHTHKKVGECRICKGDTPGLEYKECHRCYELENRIQRDPDLAAQILALYLTRQVDERRKAQKR